MNEALKRRLTGAAVLLGAAFMLTWLLPEPQPGGAGGEGGVMIIDLNAPQPAPSAPIPSTPVPEVIAAAQPVAPESEAEAETLSAPTAASEPAATAAPALVPASELESAPLRASADNDQPKPAQLPRPALKMEPQLAAKPVPPKPQAKPLPVPTPKPAWYVQTGSYSDLDKARQDEERYKSAGYKVLISPADTQTGTFYRVRLGPYPSKDTAEQARARVSTQGNAQATVIED